MSPLLNFLQHLQLATIFGFLGNTISFMVFLSPIPTFYRIYKKKSTEGYQSVPYVVALFSSMLWILYAFLTPDSTFLKTINSFGCLIQTIFITLFIIYANKEAKMSTAKLIFVMNVAGFGAIMFITFVIAKTTSVRVKILGWMCLIFSLCVFVAPLGVMRQVIRTKSVKYMPFLLSFFLTISAVVWFFYGLVRKDYYVAIPNVLGFIFGILQMILYAVYRNAKKPIEGLTGERETIHSELTGTNLDHKIIEVMNLGPQETHDPREASQLSMTKVHNNNNDCIKDDEEGVYAIEICNLNKEMIERMQRIEAMEAPPPTNVVVVAAA